MQQQPCVQRVQRPSCPAQGSVISSSFHKSCQGAIQAGCGRGGGEWGKGEAGKRSQTSTRLFRRPGCLLVRLLTPLITVLAAPLQRKLSHLRKKMWKEAGPPPDLATRLFSERIIYLVSAAALLSWDRQRTGGSRHSSLQGVQWGEAQVHKAAARQSGGRCSCCCCFAARAALLVCIHAMCGSPSHREHACDRLTHPQGMPIDSSVAELITAQLFVLSQEAPEPIYFYINSTGIAVRGCHCQ
jgi:hypothetical protein